MMANLNTITGAAVPAAYDFSGFGTIVDVGGGNGSLPASILRANPTARGILFDLPHVLDPARRQLAVPNAHRTIRRPEATGVASRDREGAGGGRRDEPTGARRGSGRSGRTLTS